jgi:four helix bundle protein
MNFRHENLDVWKLSMELTKRIYNATDSFPPEESYGLKSQIRRAAVSVTLNIAEGSGRSTKKDFSNFIRNSIGSLLEVDTALKISMELKYIRKDSYADDFEELIKELYFKLIKLGKSLKNDN